MQEINYYYKDKKNKNNQVEEPEKEKTKAEKQKEAVKNVGFEMAGSGYFFTPQEPNPMDDTDSLLDVLKYSDSETKISAVDNAPVKDLSGLSGFDYTPIAKPESNKPKLPLGEKLVKLGVINSEQLEAAIKEQNSHFQKTGLKIKLGETLVKMGACSEDDIARAISDSTGYELLSLNKSPVDMSAANLITPDIAKRYMALPIGFKDGKVLLAIQNPNDLLAMDDIALITGKDIIPVVVSDVELKKVIEEFSRVSLEAEVKNEEEREEEEEESKEDVIVTTSSDKPAVILCNQIINNAVKAGASDVHIEPGKDRFRVRLRIDGVLHETLVQSMSAFASLISRIKIISNMDIAERRIPQDGRTTIKIDNRIIDIRVASLPSVYGEKITMRLLDRESKAITIDDLGFPPGNYEAFKEVLAMPYGFLLVTGPTGSGKSTTLYACLGKLNDVGRNIITVEDPVERKVDGINQIQTNEKAGLTFASALRSILRSDPDIVMIGEIRDHETAKMAIESALTGHFVLSTLHTNDASSAVTRLGEMGVQGFLTASALAGVVAQRLVRVLCPKCKEKYTISREEMLESLPDFPFEEGETEIELYKPKGCIYCNNTGYKGRQGVYEFLTVNDEIKKLILNGGSNKDIEAAALKNGMVPLRQAGFQKVRAGATSIEELLRVIV